MGGRIKRARREGENEGKRKSEIIWREREEKRKRRQERKKGRKK